MGLQLGQAAFGSAVAVMAAGKACGCHRGVSYWDLPAEALGWSREGQTWPQHNPPTHSSLPSISQCWSDKSNHLTARAPLKQPVRAHRYEVLAGRRAPGHSAQLLCFKAVQQPSMAATAFGLGRTQRWDSQTSKDELTQHRTRWSCSLQLAWDSFLTEWQGPSRGNVKQMERQQSLQQGVLALLEATNG